ncbi:hypothetical protein AK812_SmicGene28151 [Symbiodinium microadriaticum]|uniref:Uncharacterized protein n=1 Tax=Symbiodinium microadriaticum TaxID=2951 RepID=A0A1Q9D511_SYMMI|nr:hypothetical protein AK812_SmicGene28151 [Symbiodinium microadriaticum]CAE7848729.1 unnamed protein product [Symbiodinium microadriaticum]
MTRPSTAPVGRAYGQGPAPDMTKGIASGLRKNGGSAPPLAFVLRRRPERWVLSAVLAAIFTTIREMFFMYNAQTWSVESEWSCHGATQILKVPPCQSFLLLGINMVIFPSPIAPATSLLLSQNHGALHAASGLWAGPCTEADHGLLTSKPIFNSVIVVNAHIRAWSRRPPGPRRGRAAGRRGSEAGERIPVGTDAKTEQEGRQWNVQAQWVEDFSLLAFRGRERKAAATRSTPCLAGEALLMTGPTKGKNRLKVPLVRGAWGFGLRLLASKLRQRPSRKLLLSNSLERRCWGLAFAHTCMTRGLQEMQSFPLQEVIPSATFAETSDRCRQPAAR